MKQLLCLLLLFSVSLAEAADRPNFVIIMVDDMGYAGVSCFGNPYFKTPEIDRLASEGVRLTDFHSSGTVCSPTRAGLLTGRYQQRAGIEAVIHPVREHPEHRKGLQKTEVTFAEMLQSAGYATALIGKWHQGYVHNSEDYHPQNHGFDEFIGYHSGNIDFVSHVGDHNEHDWWHGRNETKRGRIRYGPDQSVCAGVHRAKQARTILSVHSASGDPQPGASARRSGAPLGRRRLETLETRE